MGWMTLALVVVAIAVAEQVRAARRVRRRELRAGARELRAQRALGQAHAMIEALKKQNDEREAAARATAEAEAAAKASAVAVIGSALSVEEYQQMRSLMKAAQHVTCVSLHMYEPAEAEHDDAGCGAAFNELVLRVRGNRPTTVPFTLEDARRLFEAAVANANDRALARAAEGQG